MSYRIAAPRSPSGFVSTTVTHYGFCSLALANPALDERSNRVAMV